MEEVNTEKLQPRKSDEGIIFYVSGDGSQTGISIAGLERLLGLKNYRSKFFDNSNLMREMSKNTPSVECPSDYLKRSWGKVFIPRVEGIDGAKIVCRNAAVDIITYYAVEKKNKSALLSLSQFIDMGFDNWVKKITNFVIEDKQDQILSLLNDMRVEMKEMKTKVEKLDRLQGTTVKLYPGLHLINEGISVMDTSLLSSDATYSPRDWLRLKDVQLDQPTYRAFSLLVSETYKTLTGTIPSSKYEKGRNAEGKATSRRVGYGYKVHHFDILEAAFKKLLDKYPIKF